MAFSSLYIGITGLTAHADGMQVVSNNLANVSTTGYKRTQALFSDLISQQVATGASRRPSDAVQISQKGMGVIMGAIKTNFVQGGTENSNEVTDMAISGRGFFGVRDPDGGAVYYTRAGVFRFDLEGNLRDPHGNIVQGMEIDRETGALTSTGDVVLPWETVDIDGQAMQVIMSAPRATSEVQISTNLDYGNGDSVLDPANPLFSLHSAWNGTADDPIGGFGGFQTAISIYDENGGTHTLNVYYDEVNSSLLSNAVPGRSYWEFVVGINPEEDGRAGAMGTSGAGLVAMGLFTFNKYGEMMDQAVYGLADGADPASLSNWNLAGFNAAGVPTVDLTWLDGAAQSVGLNFGLTSSNGSWATGAATAGAVGTNVNNLGVMANSALDAYVRTTNYDQGSAALYQFQDGYGQGFLRGLSLATDGTLNGLFTNGQEEALYRLNLYRFNSEDGLRRLGNNLFGATTESGAAIEGLPEEDGRGSLYGNTLETSNVDMAEEFTRMILIQRGFQANTKVITTSDSVLNTTISIKR